MLHQEQINNKRAIEALRNGVPNRDAVKTLGCNQPEIEAAFIQQLNDASNVISDGNGKNAGIIVAGDFGSGKSHLLEHLAHIALERNFVCSKVVVSKETPLYDSAKLFRAAAESAVISGKRGNAMTEVASSLQSRTHSKAYTDLFSWAHQDAGISMVFGAILYLIERMPSDPEVFNRIIRFLSGDKINFSELRRYLRACGEKATYRFETTTPRDFALQRFKFVARMIGAAGYSGWVLLIDEVELIARYSLLQRAKSYAEIALWLGNAKDADIAGLTSVLAITEDFSRTIINEKDDLERAPNRLLGSGNPSNRSLADGAEKGIWAIRNAVMRLRMPQRDDVLRMYEKVRQIHGRAYGWTPPPIQETDQATSTRMRQHIRSWITQWDLIRLDPQYHPDIETGIVKMDYSEDADLEVQSAEEGETGSDFN